PKAGQPIRRAEALSERPDRAVEKRERAPHDDDREQAASRALKRAEVIEGPPNEGIGGADQFGYFDLVAVREDLQPDGVEDNGHQPEAEQDCEQPKRKAANGRQRREAPRPCSVGLDMRDAW